MTAALDTLLAEARSQDLIQPLGAFEVHCRHCHARLSGTGDCATCGLIGRPEAELMRRAATDSEGIARLLEISIARRKSFGPGETKKSAEAKKGPAEAKKATPTAAAAGSATGSTGAEANKTGTAEPGAKR